jgi:hypothetical protein
VYTKVWLESRKERRQKERGINRAIILIWILKKWDVENMDWIHLVQDGDQCRAVVIMVMNLFVP